MLFQPFKKIFSVQSPDAVDVWYRISSQRKGALRDIVTLELSMQIVLCNAHELLNKRKFFCFFFFNILAVSIKPNVRSFQVA